MFFILNILILSSCNNKKTFGEIVNYKFEKSYGLNFRGLSTSNNLEPPISINILIPNIFLENKDKDADTTWDYIYIDESKGINYRMLITGLYEVNNTFPNDEEIWLKHKGHIYEVKNMDEILSNNKITEGINDNNYNYVMYVSYTDETSFTDIYIKINEKYYIEIYLQLDLENTKNIQNIINSIKVK